MDQPFPLFVGKRLFENRRRIKSSLPTKDNSEAGEITRFLETIGKRYFIAQFRAARDFLIVLGFHRQ